MTREKIIRFAIPLVLIFAVIFPHKSGSAWLSIGTTFLIYALVALSQDIVLGKAGVYDMGHAIYFGMGAYIFSIAVTKFNMDFVTAATLASFGPAFIAIAIAAPILHLRGDYFLVVSIGLNIIFFQLLSNNPFGLTGGPNGLFGIFPEPIFGVDLTAPIFIYYYALVVVSGTILMLHFVDNSRFGRAVYFVAQDELAAQSMGVNPYTLKLMSFAFSAVLAGFAGVLYSLEYSAVSPETFTVNESIILFAIVIVGGQGSIAGVLLGTFVMFVMPEMFRGFAQVRYLIFGAAMVLLMIMRPHGLLPTKFGFFPKKMFEGDK